MQSSVLRRFVPIAALALCAPAFGQFSDGFEAYACPSQIEGQGGWHNWDTGGAGGPQPYNTVECAATVGVTPFAGNNMLKIEGCMNGCGYLSDTVHELNGPYTSGQWTFKCMQYIPGTFAGTTYIIGMNTYADNGGPYNWSMQVNMDANTAQVNADGAYQGASPTIVFDQWVEFRAEIDLDADFAELFYDNISLGTAQWSVGVSTTGGVARIAALDLFPGDDNVTRVFYDDVSLEPAAGAIQVACDPANDHTGGNYAKLDNSSLGSGIGSGLHIECTDGKPGEFGYLLISSEITEPGVPVSNGILCLRPPQGRYSPAAGVSALNSIGSFDGTGTFQSIVQAQSGWDVPTPLPNPPGGSIAAGDTWYFQMWYRDGQRSNFSNAICVTF